MGPRVDDRRRSAAFAIGGDTRRRAERYMMPICGTWLSGPVFILCRLQPGHTGPHDRYIL